MLTIQEIKNAKVGEKPRKLYDRDGLYLFVTPTGGKLWRGKYRVNGREKTLSLGPYPKVGLAEAREKWQDARKLDDPSAAKQAEKQASDSTTPTFLAVAKEGFYPVSTDSCKTAATSRSCLAARRRTRGL
jgi:hypothetical protein